MPIFRLPSGAALSTVVLSAFVASMGCGLVAPSDRTWIPADPDLIVDAADPTPKIDEGLGAMNDAGASEMVELDGAVVSGDAGATADAGNDLDTGEADVLGNANSKVIYLTSMPKKANFGGIAGADGLCNANPPVAGTYRALIADGATRAVGMNWAMAPSTKYVRADGTTVIGTTNSNGTFVFPLNASMGTIGAAIWTGLDADWSDSEDDCNNWSGTVGFSATAGLADMTDSQAIMGVLENCATLAGAFFACVQQ